ncbi:uncharacterized protein METZ01_LOCUS104512, partial [marine metagenome]|jgi:hypothetical protein|tara:strand:+ start:1029 stop:1664 length:636 start_codon:yes stop_codon:yes gene_type:complete
VKYAFFAIVGLVVLGFGFTFAYAHTTIQIDPYEIEVGWQDEPPVVGILNAITIDIREPGDVEGVSTGVINAFKKLDASVVSGGASKVLDINTDPRPGHYYAKIIPTKTGSLEVKLVGEINGVQINTIIPIEDVESTSVLDFPPTSTSSSGQEVTALKNAVTSLQQDISSIKAQGSTSTGSDEGIAYNFAVFGISLGAAGVILAIIAMVRRK